MTWKKYLSELVSLSFGSLSAYLAAMEGIKFRAAEITIQEMLKNPPSQLNVAGGYILALEGLLIGMGFVGYSLYKKLRNRK